MAKSQAYTYSILIVDDQKDDLAMLTQMLKKPNYVIRPVNNGHMALNAAHIAPPDLILLDIMMPEIDGYEVCRRLKSDEITRDIPVIFLSVHDDLENKVKAFQAGGIDYITKPFQIEEVQARVETHLKLRSMQKQLQEQNTTLQQKITEQQLAEASLKESEERYRRLIELSPDAIVVHQTDKIAYINPAGVTLLAANHAEELIGKPIMEFVCPDYQNIVRTRIHTIYEKKERTAFIEEKFIRLDQCAIDVEVAAVPITLHGKPAVQVVARDITERKQGEEALRASEERFRLLAENLPGVVYLCLNDERYTMLYLNDRIETLTGYPKEEFLADRMSFVDLYHPDDREMLISQANLAISQKRPFHLIYRMYHHSGEIRWIEEFGAGVFEEDRLRFLEGFLSDITDRKRMEDRLGESRARYRTLIENIPDIVYYLDHERRFKSFNRAGLNFFGFRRGEHLIGQHFSACIHPEDRQMVAAAYQEAIHACQTTMKALQFRILARDEIVRWAELHTRMIFDSQGTYQEEVGLLSDITERKQIETELRKLSRAVDQSASMIVITDPRGTIEFVNPAFSAITGYAAEEVLGKNPRLLKSGKHPPELYRELWETITAGNVWHGELINKKKNGELYWETVIISPVKDREKQITHYVAVKDDITKRKQAEEALQKLNQELEAVNASKDKFLSIIAHDLRNPFTTLIGLTESIMKSIEHYSKAEIKHAIWELRTSAESVYALLENLLAWSRFQRGMFEYAPETLDLHQIVTRNVELVRPHAAQKEVKLKNLVAKNMTVYADHNMIDAVLRNLLSNAVKFSYSGGTITLSAHQDEDCVEVAVTDTGKGISQEDLPKLFRIDVKYTKPGTAGEKGTGLGLILCKDLIEKNNGKLWVKSTPGKGTTFYVALPHKPLKGSAPLKLKDITTTEQQDAWLSKDEVFQHEEAPALKKLLVPPSQEQLNALIRLARVGDIMGLQKHIMYLKHTNPPWIEFLNALSHLVDKFEIIAIQEFLNQYIER